MAVLECAWSSSSIRLILAARGVPAKVFLALQAEALRDIQRIVTSIRAASRLLPMHGLGAAFDVPAVLLNIHRLLRADDFEAFARSAGMLGPFLRDCLQLCMLHIKRALKHKARIPVPFAHLLVGVPDETGTLAEGEIYCSVRNRYETHSTAYKGPVLVIRSPTVHVRATIS